MAIEMQVPHEYGLYIIISGHTFYFLLVFVIGFTFFYQQR